MVSLWGSWRGGNCLKNVCKNLMKKEPKKGGRKKSSHCMSVRHKNVGPRREGSGVFGGRKKELALAFGTLPVSSVLLPQRRRKRGGRFLTSRRKGADYSIYLGGEGIEDGNSSRGEKRKKKDRLSLGMGWVVRD